MIICKDVCIQHQQVSKKQIYNLGGCFCRVCEYYFRENFDRCPCCNNIARQRARSNRRLKTEFQRIL